MDVIITLYRLVINNMVTSIDGCLHQRPHRLNVKLGCLNNVYSTYFSTSCARKSILMNIEIKVQRP